MRNARIWDYISRSAAAKAALLCLSVSTSLAPALSQGTRPPSATHASSCRGGQLAVGGLGSSAAAGTVILTVRVTDISGAACSIAGSPAVAFVGSGGVSLKTSVAHLGPGQAFDPPRQVLLVPSS